MYTPMGIAAKKKKLQRQWRNREKNVEKIT